MSHFTCLAIGQDVDQMMEKYDEQDERFHEKHFEEDTWLQSWYERVLKHENKDDEETYNKFIAKSGGNESLEAFFDYIGDRYCYEDDIERMKVYDNNGFMYYIIKDGKSVGYVCFSNPNAKYDYYSEGGRWDGLLMKDGSTQSSGKIGDIDIEGILKEKMEERANDYDGVINAVGHIPTHTVWSEFHAKIKSGELTRDDAVELYDSQEDVVKFKKFSKEQGWFMTTLDEFKISREEYINQANLPIFCANINGDWYEKGEMGWWACVSNEKESNAWKNELISRINEEIEKNPEQEFTFLDCHI